ncbi:hypothetical protein [Paracoccus tegillarcae]|uniref:Uncharacterized protein n=1 Tax=Paracoccus tegillarcae TaxID=1529068 RepID=A0A2K9F3Q5_9RHOB|nr:hypothetical protein [Paracoccus tegillarcae]AUH35012.1 hypothetical protein CUV01_17980 [Paracoccus tegillarcae]
MLTALLLPGLFIVMMAQGAALQPRHLWEWRDDWPAISLAFLLRLIVVPVVVLLLAKPLIRYWDIDVFAGAGLVIAFLAPPSVAAMALVAISGGVLPLLATLIIGGTVISVLLWPVLGGPLMNMADAPWLWTDVLLWVVMPVLLGMFLRGKGYAVTRFLPILASVVTGATIIAALYLGWDDDSLSILLATTILLFVVLILTILAGRLIRLGGDALLTLCLTVLIPVVVMPIALGTRTEIPQMGFASACYGIIGYVLAFVLIVLRQRSRA